VLALVAVVGFAYFLVWELTDKHPVVDLRLFARRNFASACCALSVAYGLFFGNVVLLPLWLQQWMGYTPPGPAWRWRRWACLAIVLTPLVGRKVGQWDPRWMATFAFAMFALVMWHARGVHAAERLRAHPRADGAAGRRGGVLLHPADDAVAGRHRARAAAGRRGPVELRAHDGGRVRRFGVDDVVGEPRATAPRASRRAPGRRRPGAAAGAGRIAGWRDENQAFAFNLP
jgi:hypothetical protein